MSGKNCYSLRPGAHRWSTLIKIVPFTLYIFFISTLIFRRSIKDIIRFHHPMIGLRVSVRGLIEKNEKFQNFEKNQNWKLNCELNNESCELNVYKSESLIFDDSKSYLRCVSSNTGMKQYAFELSDHRWAPGFLRVKKSF